MIKPITRTQVPNAACDDPELSIVFLASVETIKRDLRRSQRDGIISSWYSKVNQAFFVFLAAEEIVDPLPKAYVLSHPHPDAQQSSFYHLRYYPVSRCH